MEGGEGVGDGGVGGSSTTTTTTSRGYDEADEKILMDLVPV